MDEIRDVFSALNAVNVNGHTETKKQGGASLTYLSWPYAWAEVKKRYPGAQYTIYRGSNGLPYMYDANTGYMVSTTVTIEGVTHEMWLPVMDAQNAAMKSLPYEVETQRGKRTVKAATMFDVNKAIMRCLTKNLAMFGLGLYIYAGEDLPETEDPTKQEPTKQEPKQAANVPYLICADCGEHITEAFTKDGKPLNLADYEAMCKRYYNRVICRKCRK